ncbi:hypothetical protein R5R35_006352 [Gryllus longicercus]|uniref:Uncharacterized protein n=1 Tax=Gryllus longicercus TaxID=2509291 RepID=A0AAN9W3G5_9ORTH|nr:Uncharacterized protein GBIM_20538 [Gryllus bimaculatus]
MRGRSRTHSPCSQDSMDKENCPDSNILRRTRRRLQQRFDNNYCRAPEEKQNAEKSWNAFTLPSVTVPRIHPARVLRSGANTLSRTLNSVQTTFGSLSQKFRRSTKRRHQFKNESPCTPVTPQTRSRHILGRTPTKLYSPFGIESPCKKLRDKENHCMTEKPFETHRYIPRKLIESSKYNYKCTRVIANETMVNEKRNFDPDVEEVRIGMWELRQTAHSIVKRSLQQ